MAGPQHNSNSSGNDNAVHSITIPLANEGMQFTLAGARADENAGEEGKLNVGGDSDGNSDGNSNGDSEKYVPRSFGGSVFNIRIAIVIALVCIVFCMICAPGVGKREEEE
jgi:hypothetical protein